MISFFYKKYLKKPTTISLPLDFALSIVKSFTKLKKDKAITLELIKQKQDWVTKKTKKIRLIYLTLSIKTLYNLAYIFC